jgi:hypothetical protein
MPMRDDDERKFRDLVSDRADVVFADGQATINWARDHRREVTVGVRFATAFGVAVRNKHEPQAAIILEPGEVLVIRTLPPALSSRPSPVRVEGAAWQADSPGHSAAGVMLPPRVYLGDGKSDDPTITDDDGEID